MNNDYQFNDKAMELVREYLSLGPEGQRDYHYLLLNPEKLNIKDNQLSQASNRFTIRDAAYALQPHPPIEWIVQNLISEGSVNVIVGESGSKKTYSMLSLAVCVAIGKTWVGLETSPERVLIIDEESGERRFTRRLREALRGEHATGETPIKYISYAEFQFDRGEEVVILSELIQKTEAGLVIIDSLAGIMTGDENSKQDMQPIFSMLRKVADQHNTAIIVIHHTNKGGSYRGSSAIKGAVDVMVIIKSENGREEVYFETEKNRDGESVQFSGRSHWLPDEFWLTQNDTQADQPRKTLKVHVSDYVEINGPVDKQTLYEEYPDYAERTISGTVQELVNEGKLKRINSEQKGRGVKAIYDIDRGSPQLDD